MRISICVLTAVLLAILTFPGNAQEYPALQKISSHVYAYVASEPVPENPPCFGANAGIVVGDRAVLVVDTLSSAKEAERFLEDIRRRTSRPISFVINTHSHIDHALGNCVFAGIGARIIAHEKSAEMVKTLDKAVAHPELWGIDPKSLDHTTVVHPSWTFEKEMSIDLGGLTVRIRSLGPTHSPDSVIVEVPSDHVCFTGDILFTKYHPFMGDGQFDNWRKALARLELESGVTFIPGHGPISTVKDLERMKTYLISFDRIAKRICAGKTMSDVSELAKRMLEKLPAQGRGTKTTMIEANLGLRYLSPAPGK